MELLLTVLVLVPILWCIDGYPTGAHSDACGPMIPRHVGAYPQHTPSPYSVLTNSKMFYPGYPVTVTIAGPQYRGLLLQARSHESNDALGSWQLPPPDTKFLNCSNNPHGAMTHSNPNLKGVTTVYSWVPPDFHGPIYFMVTVVQERTVFWVHLSSIHVFRGNTESVIFNLGVAIHTHLKYLVIYLKKKKKKLIKNLFFKHTILTVFYTFPFSNINLFKTQIHNKYI
uniref:Reelin domain-containing protein n=1 Tax=Gouania willdenowi TaxID=441366 RepID=A0A8C5E418_GOUWI